MFGSEFGFWFRFRFIYISSITQMKPLIGRSESYCLTGLNGLQILPNLMVILSFSETHNPEIALAYAE